MSDVRVLPQLPNLSKLMFQAMTTAFGRPGAKAGLPDRSVMVLDHIQDPERLAAYNRVTGFGLRSQVPATWLHVLSFPLQAYLMAEKDFPFPLAGLVHVSNQQTLHLPVEVSDQLRISVKAENLAPHKRGVSFDLVGNIHIGEELAWSGSSNYLAMGQKLDGEPAGSPPRLEPPALPASQLWRLPGDLGRRYAAVSGDNNPIHLYPLTARLFGFKRPIIHGMWTHAKALASLEPQLPETYSTQVAFTKPISLPGRATFAADRVEDSWRFAVANSDQSKTYLVGEVTPA